MNAVLVVVVEVEPDAEEELNRWYDERHVPERLAMDGFVSARRFVSAEHPGRYLAVYELDRPEAATGSAYLDAARALETAWDRSVAARWTLLGREVWNEVTPDRWGPAPPASA